MTKVGVELQELIAAMEQRRTRVEQGGGPERLKKQKAGGKLTARERIEALLDPGSFLEMGTFVEHRGGRLMQGVDAPGEGVVTGRGTIDGRQVFVFSQDFTVLGGSLGKMNAAKITKIMDMAARTGCPVIGLNDSAGARIQEGVDSLSGYGEIFYRNAIYSGAVPQISAILGPCAGGAVYSPALTDFILMSEGSSYMFITGPEVIKSVTREDVTFDQLGGADVHTRRSGVAHLAYDGDEAVLAGIRDLLGYLPQNAHEKAPAHPTQDPATRMNERLLDIVVPDQRKPYAMHDVIHELVDDGTFLEIQPNWAKNIVVGFARLNGESVGIVANNPRVMAGTLNIDASDKAARFIRTCDCYNIPILTLVDVTGFLPGVAQEHAGIIRHGAKMLYAYAEATVPKVTLITRKSYGGAYLAMNSRDMGADVVYAWPTAAVAVMGAEGAANIVYRRDIQSSDNPDATRAQKIAEYKDAFDNPYVAASKGYIDDVIPMEDTRRVLIQTFEMLRDKEEARPYKKHGNIPL
ncbi:acyl-CoA carboxylase subunit beta [Deinococcus soli (ex Cha et al. 2016)]|uniref:Acetyl-CoA carboxylase carboxyltransferase component n=2 Tax=Deinococcus soli (ex Cha et al. 2016) TaxID=1309411 RepID=A0ACC6KMT3_9DEIO|nr:acyl-CoA carboxylase subunit beta [Deinococcus soli (ex Cha et al. 2016)]MDR6220769.1 acetyl-CoA carboxylase carboxyltransferase component [Deinococcus soli (ex Cha et al. 2016)]MDR6330704.1 acetyl-CoA carboxylase carboxyltransferase component [Deinococcus soli (ex Cha et al. 2016)]MDR6753746.1 acetyl-CoA carboxylase carboxyltransferase component [Deinococcus soli (ex Cha et al. 2016)]